MSSPASNKKTYFQMVKEAIAALADRTGSSNQAIKGWITLTYPTVAFAPHHFRSALKKGVEDGKLVKTQPTAGPSSSSAVTKSAHDVEEDLGSQMDT